MTIRGYIFRVFRILMLAALCLAVVSFADAQPRSIKVVMDDNYPPYVFRNNDGTLQGVLIDQWRLWEQKNGIRVEIHAMDWGKALSAMKAGEFDVIDTIFKTDERTGWLDFTGPYADIEVPIFFNKDIAGITDATSLKGFLVATKTGDAAVELLKHDGVDTLVLFNSYESILRAAKAGEVTVFVVDAPPALYFLHKFGISDQYNQSAPLNVGQFHRAVKKGNCELLKVIEDGFGSISAGELKAIDARWHGSPLYDRRLLRLWLMVTGSLGLLLVFFVVWTRLLRRKVRARTAELNASLSSLRESHALFSQFMRHSPIYAFIKEVKPTESRVLHASENFHEMIGIPGCEIIGKTMTELFSPEIARKITNDDWAIVSKGEVWRQEEAANGRSYITIKFPMILSDRTLLAGYTIDITERKHAEEELIRARDLAQQASQAKSQFLATMSHELRTPLNPILGFADLLAESPNLTDEQQVWLRIITQRGQDLLALIGSVLDLAKIEAKKIIITREPLLLRQTVRDLVESFLPAASKKHLHLEWAVESELPDRVLADGFRLHQVLMNLLNNALKFTHQGGIDVRVQDGRAARLMREPSDGESALLFRIQDTGIGIATDRQEVVFEAFTHANQHDAVKYGGAGLGLAIASQLVELMGGRIWVESTPGKGSTFLFTILVGLSREAGTQGATGSGAV